MDNLAFEFEKNREGRISPTPMTPSVVLYYPALRYCYLRSNHDTLICYNVLCPSDEVDSRQLQLTPLPLNGGHDEHHRLYTTTPNSGRAIAT